MYFRLSVSVRCILIVFFFIAGPSHEGLNADYSHHLDLFNKLRENNMSVSQASSNTSRELIMNILKIKKYERNAWSNDYGDNIKSLIRTVLGFI